jgi:hypothetical protein
MKKLLLLIAITLVAAQVLLPGIANAEMPNYPKVRTLPASNITDTSAVLNCVVYDMAPPVFCGMVSFIWGEAPNNYPNMTTPQMVSDNVNISAAIAGLRPGTTYYARSRIVRCDQTNPQSTWMPSGKTYGAGIGFNGLDLRAARYGGVGCEFVGNEISFTTDTRSASAITNLGNVVFAISGGSISGLRNVTTTCGASGFSFPYGMFSFNITNLTPGQSVNVTIRFINSLPAGTKYYKCINGAIVDCTSIMSRPDERTIMLTLRDGGLGDADGSANGSITDPGGPAFPLNIPQSSSAQMPSVSQSPMKMSNIAVKSASLSAVKVTPGSPVTVTAEVANTGAVNGTTMVKVYVNGQEESSQGMTVNSGSVTPVTFTVSRNEPGTYSVYVGGAQAGSFTVTQFDDAGVILMISGALVFFAFITGLAILMRKQRA